MSSRTLQKLFLLGCAVGISSFMTISSVSASGFALKQGMQSDDVKLVQTKLKDLGYFNDETTGYFGEVTKAAVEKYQKANNFTVDGIVGSATWSALVGNAKPTTEPKIQKEAPKFSSLIKKGMTGKDIKLVQDRLKDLGYFNENTTEYFGDVTKVAVEKFQKARGLNADGIVGQTTWNRLFDISSSIVSTSRTIASSRVAVSRGSVSQDDPMVPWSEAQNVFKIGDTATVIDILTGEQFQIRRTYGYNHADSETLTADDTAIMKKIYGGSWNWQRRPIVLIVRGQWIAASMAGMPHAGLDEEDANVYVAGRSGGYGKGTNLDTVKGNGMDGHFDVHFLNSRTHSTNRVDSDHQAAIKKAAEYIKSIR